MSMTLETVMQTMELTAHEKASLVRFAPAIRMNDALRAEVELFAALPEGSRVPLVAFDRVMRAYRAWLVFAEFES